ncbi:GumC family protein [Ulvibacter antarcticus]|uniref:non-specific protein-tyrosine kinase n=1 Tax=Ulvibacter antarcticus TaxID=442714 RepID=A0A3L9YE39_9FLAO|nr:polysaccharide biosynthesis tyrosine autokinase [Ulvibacter antarcticus]RMA58963.1 capsular exopolysaccharide synthesis family protein [Ulvibacter antarcticus]
MNNSPTNISEIKEQSIKELLKQYVRYWYLFLFGILIALTGAYIYLRYATKTYATSSTIIIKDEKKGGGAAELAAFSDLSLFSNAFSDNIANELVILRSKSLIGKTVESLNLNVQYFYEGSIKTSELYVYKPFKVNYLSVSDKTQLTIPQLVIIMHSDAEFTIEDINKTFSKKYSFGDKIDLPFGDLVVVPNTENIDKFNNYLEKPIHVVYHSVENVAAHFQGLLNLVHDGKNGEVVSLKLTSSLPVKAEDFLNELVYQYNQDAINDRSQIAQKTSNFIDSRLEIITRELDSVENNKERFKSTNRLTDIEAEANLILENASDYNKRQVDTSTQLELIDSMISYMDSTSSIDLLPSNIGIDNGEIQSSVGTYNQLVLEKNRLLKNSTSKNPVIINLDSQIEQLKSSISGSLKNQQRFYQVAIKDLNNQENIFNAKLSQVPEKEKLFRGIVRQQNIKEQLYLFLLQQREETSISLAVTSSKAKVVDAAYSGKGQESPKPSLIYLLSFILGLLVPFLLIYIYYLFNTKVSNRSDVERVHRTTPLIGEIPKLSRGEEELIKHNDRSILAESFRILRTNLQYLLAGKTTVDGGLPKKIFVTSTIKGEGKTFVAFNLALSLAQTGKKVVLVGADIRNPQLHRYLPGQQKDKKGLTEYIIDHTIAAADLASQSEYNENLSIIMSGVIPPNPAELLMQPRTNIFFEEIKDLYDFIIVDTAPSMLVTDTILINKIADVTLYVIRANFTDKKLMEFPKDAIEEGRLANIALVLNSVTMSNFGYGNKYGYTYSEEKKTFFQRLFNR